MSLPGNFSCGISPVTNVGPVCGGHGTCVYDPSAQRGRCECDPGWFGESDFRVTNSALDCQINDTLVRVLWGIFLFIHIAVYIGYLPKVRWLWDKHMTLVQRQKAVGKKYRLWNNKGFFSFFPYLTLGWTCQTVYAIVKIVNQQQFKLGENVFVTILYIIWRITFYFTVDTFQPSFLESLLKTQQKSKAIIATNNVLTLFHMIFTILISITTITPIAIAETEFDTTVGMVSSAVFFLWCAIAMLFFGVQATYIQNKAVAVLDESLAISRDEKTNRIKAKITSFQKTNVKQGFLQFVIYGTFGAFPYLWNKHDYMLPFSWVAVAVTIRTGIGSIVHEEKDQNSSSSKATSPVVMNRKQPSNPKDDSIQDSEASTKPMHVHGLDLDPMVGVYSSAQVGSSDQDTLPNESKTHGELAVAVRVSPAMRLLRAMTPSRREAAQARFGFQEESFEESNKI